MKVNKTGGVRPIDVIIFRVFLEKLRYFTYFSIDTTELFSVVINIFKLCPLKIENGVLEFFDGLLLMRSYCSVEAVKDVANTVSFQIDARAFINCWTSLSRGRGAYSKGYVKCVPTMSM